MSFASVNESWNWMLRDLRVKVAGYLLLDVQVNVV